MLEGESHETLDDVVSSSLPPFSNVHNDVGINEDNDLFSYLFDDVGVSHDDYWGYFGLPIYDSSRAPSVVLEALKTPHLEVILAADLAARKGFI